MLLYECEIWLLGEDVRRLAFDYRCVRNTLKFEWSACVSDEEVKNPVLRIDEENILS